MLEGKNMMGHHLHFDIVNLVHMETDNKGLCVLLVEHLVVALQHRSFCFQRTDV